MPIWLIILATAIVAYKIGKGAGYQRCIRHIAILFPDQAKQIGIETEQSAKDFLTTQRENAGIQ